MRRWRTVPICMHSMCWNRWKHPERNAGDPIVLIEQCLDFSKWVPEGFGTGDCVIVADEMLTIIDMKYGVGILVSAEKNPQMMCYALGALALFDGIYDITEVAMTIFQPRRDNISTYTIQKKNFLSGRMRYFPLPHSLRQMARVNSKPEATASSAK